MMSDSWLSAVTQISRPRAALLHWGSEGWAARRSSLRLSSHSCTCRRNSQWGWAAGAVKAAEGEAATAALAARAATAAAAAAEATEARAAAAGSGEAAAATAEKVAMAEAATGDRRRSHRTLL